MADLPTGIVTFLLTDIERSTALWERQPDAMRLAVARHDVLVHGAVEQHAGIVVKSRGEGDSVFAVFGRVSDAVLAAVQLQRALQAEPWPAGAAPQVRVALHTGEAELRDGDYFGSAVNRCARLRAAAHGGQILLSQASRDLLDNTRPANITAIDLGEHRLRDVPHPERIYQAASPDLPLAFPPLRGLDAHPQNLPVHRSALIGREREIADVSNLLLRPDIGLVTLIGPGGTGKTRLAGQVAAAVLGAFPDGAFFVPLAPIREPELVALTIGQVLGIAMDAGRPPLNTLGEYLRDRAMLLVLDNLEQVIEVGSRFAELLATSARLKLLVTSRVALRVSEEHAYDVPPLALPPPGSPVDGNDVVAACARYDAIRLFVERAQAVRADFALTSTNARDVVEVCRRLDGLPLAIELAAARARLLPPAAMLARLAGPIDAPSLRLLTGGPRDQPARLQTLRGTIGWSYDLLEPEEQALFRCLAIFVGGCTIEEAEAAYAATARAHTPSLDVLDGIDSLLAQSLLRRQDGPDGEPRYTMLETIREFGLESLALTGELPSLRRWHAEYFLALAETAEPRMRGPEQARWLDRLAAEHDNLRAGLEWGLSPDGTDEIALRLCGALAWFWYNRSHLEEARRRLAQVLARGAGASLARVKALAGAGRLAHIQHDSAQARALLSESLALARDLRDPWWEAWALHLLGRVAYFDRDAETARSLGFECLAVAREIDDAWLVGWAFHLLGLASHIEDDFVTARRYYEESLTIRRPLDFREGTSTLLTLLALIDFRERDYPSACARLQESLDLLWGIDWAWLMGNLIAQFLAVAVAIGQLERGARLWGALTTLSESVSTRPIPLVEAFLGPALESARHTLGEEAFTVARQAGQRMSRDDIMAEIRAISVVTPPSVAAGHAAGGATMAALADPSSDAPSGTGGTPTPSAMSSALARTRAAFPAGLTAREVEVLRLIAAGATSKEIAQRLVISIHTVERHITHTYQKIGARGRADATAYALQHGLA
ncbi:MAG: hypothetical protein IT305_30995 [Chloroflexi bacterium]|nr:hypothetical protein [Chloroflexota bacterium]